MNPTEDYHQTVHLAINKRVEILETQIDKLESEMELLRRLIEQETAATTG